MKLMPLSKKWLLPLLLCVNLASCSNDNAEDKSKSKGADTPVPAASYYLQVPTGWTTERITFPIDFAPGINYAGTEDLRFAKGWNDIISDEHWCYAFARWLDGKPVINGATLQQNLTEYYSGLVKRNIIQKKIPENKIVPTVATIKTIPTMNGDIATYNGTISMLDYHSENPIVLQCMIHIKNCATKGHTALLFQISPKPFDHSVWKPLNSLNTNFTCGD